MTFKTDGSSHKTGINGENELILFFNNKSNFDFVKKMLEKTLNIEIKNMFAFEQRGGTNNRTDIYDPINNISISVKSKKYDGTKYHGTFDLINTSKIENFIDKDNVIFLKELKTYNDLLENLKQTGKNKSTAEINKIVNPQIAKIVNSITSKTIKLIFDNIIQKEKDLIEVVRDFKNDVSDDIKKEDIHILKPGWIKHEVDQLDFSSVFFNKNKSDSNKSFMLVNKDNTNSIFRIRMALNNGVTALMVSLNLIEPKKGKNSSSVLTFKIQVDKVSEVVKKYDISNIRKEIKNYAKKLEIDNY